MEIFFTDQGKYGLSPQALAAGIWRACGRAQHRQAAADAQGLATALAASEGVPNPLAAPSLGSSAADYAAIAAAATVCPASVGCGDVAVAAATVGAGAAAVTGGAAAVGIFARASSHAAGSHHSLLEEVKAGGRLAMALGGLAVSGCACEYGSRLAPSSCLLLDASAAR